MTISYKVVKSTKEVDLLETPLYWNLVNNGALRIVPNFNKEKDIVSYSITCLENLCITHEIVNVTDILNGSKKVILENDDYTFLLLQNDLGNFDGAMSKTYFNNKLEQIYNKLK